VSGTDYQRIYNEYWSQTDRWGSFAIQDVEALADEILATCGGGAMLDVGCGMGHLVRTLLQRAIDARGVDVSSRAIDALNQQVPDRFDAASILELPYPDGAFQTVVSTDVLEHLVEADVDRALSELHRVTQRYAFIVLSTAPDRDAQWHQTLRPRDWWNERFFAAGFRKHPRTPLLLDYESIETEGHQILLLFEKVPIQCLRDWPMEKLQACHTLHADMLRETGRRSDAHITRYALAIPYVRQNDVVLDAGCGFGYGAAILAAGSLADRIIAVDDDAETIDYARSSYAQAQPIIEYRQSNVTQLSSIQDHSIDLVVAMEILEHLEQPDDFLDEVQRILKPAGRMILSIPNEWTDESGQDPNPYHHQVYTWEKLKAQIDQRFLFEKAFAQIAGGAIKLPDGKRSLREVSIQACQNADAEWWIAVAMQDPLATSDIPYIENNFPGHVQSDAYHLTAFDRDYDNPGLAKAMVIIGMRATNPAMLELLAKRTVQSARLGSPDYGAALCVLAYRLLERNDVQAGEVRELLARIADYQKQADDSPHAWRWRISNQYVTARLQLSLGESQTALETFVACADMDPVRFSPLLATKTVDALYHAGLIEAIGQHVAQASEYWQRAITEVRRALSGDWLNIWGNPTQPASFGLPEVAQLADLAARCGFGLLALDRWSDAPGLAWERAQICQAQHLKQVRRSKQRHLAAVRELQSWIREMGANQKWIEDQRREWEKTAQSYHGQIGELQEWIQQLEEAKAYLEQQRSAWEKTAQERGQQIEELNKMLNAFQEAADQQSLLRRFKEYIRKRDQG